MPPNTIVAGPVEWLIGAARALKVDPTLRRGQEAGRRAAPARAAAVLPAQRQRLALRPCLAFHRRGRPADPAGGLVKAGDISFVSSSPLLNESTRSATCSDRQLLRPDGAGTAAAGEQSTAADHRRTELPRIPRALRGMKPMPTLNRRNFLLASGGVGAAAVAAGATGVTWRQLMARRFRSAAGRASRCWWCLTLYGGNDGLQHPGSLCRSRLPLGPARAGLRRRRGAEVGRSVRAQPVHGRLRQAVAEPPAGDCSWRRYPNRTTATSAVWTSGKRPHRRLR